MTTLNVSVTPELAEFVNQQVMSGMYPSDSEVIGEGLRLLKEQDELRRLRLEELRREIQKGIESSERGEVSVYHSGEEFACHIEAEGRKLLALRRGQQ